MTLDLARRVTFAALVLTAATAGAAGQRSLGEFRDWSAIRYGDDDAPVCMIWSAPKKEEGDYTRRGDVYVFVTHRPKQGERNRVGFEAGYPFAEDATVKVRVDYTHFELRTAGSTAFPATPRDGARLVAAMRAGREMVVEGRSRRGTDTRDTYSLYGFSAAHEAIDKACR